MASGGLDIVILGLSITSSWGNGHATTYRSLVRELASRGHRVLFLERDKPWYRANRDMPAPGYGAIELYSSIEDLKSRFHENIRTADFVMVGSYVPEGAKAGEWVVKTAKGVTAFYDVDTPVTLSRLRAGKAEYLNSALVPEYDIYLSFTGGRILQTIERELGSPMARPLYCSVDPELYSPEEAEKKWDLGYIGTYSADRQPALDSLMLDSARGFERGRFVVAGPLYPENIAWPGNTERIEHLPPSEHRRFYNSMRFTMNLTRADMVRAGYSPSVRLFEAAACGTPIITDYWKGLDAFFEPGREILVSGGASDTALFLREMPESERRRLGERARRRVLDRHTARHRVDELESYIEESFRARGERRCAMRSKSAEKNIAVFGIYGDRVQVEDAIDALRDAGFRPTDISILFPENVGSKDLAHERRSKAPEGAVKGGGSGAAVAGALGWLASVGAISVPGIGPLLAAGPILSLLAGVGFGGAIGALAGALIGLGMPEYEAKRYEGRVRKGSILVSVHSDSTEWAKKAKLVLGQTGAEDISAEYESRADYGASERPVVRGEEGRVKKSGGRK